MRFLSLKLMDERATQISVSKNLNVGSKAIRKRLRKLFSKKRQKTTTLKVLLTEPARKQQSRR